MIVELAHRVEALFGLADPTEARFETAQSRIRGITPSLLARAFAGKLVPQNPTDEPAEKLLEWIRSEKPPKRQRETHAS